MIAVVSPQDEAPHMPFGARRTLERQDLGDRVHHRRVGGDRPAQRVRRVGHVDDDDLILLADLLADADELVRLHGQGVEPNVGGIDADLLELDGPVRVNIDRRAVVVVSGSTVWQNGWGTVNAPGGAPGT